MGVDAVWDDHLQREWERWIAVRLEREHLERTLPPDERLDDLGREIFFYLVRRGMSPARAAKQALDGHLRARLKVRDSVAAAYVRDLEAHFEQIYPGRRLAAFEGRAEDELDFWSSRLHRPEFVYFIQDGQGAVKIGRSNDPRRRLAALQTGNPRQLFLRHVVPGDLTAERGLHERFEPARIRGEWFDGEYLPVILAFGSGLAEEMIYAYNGTGDPPALVAGQVRGTRELLELRREIERLRIDGHESRAIAAWLRLDEDELERHLDAMRASTFYDTEHPGGHPWLGAPWRRKGRRRRDAPVVVRRVE